MLFDIMAFVLKKVVAQLCGLICLDNCSPNRAVRLDNIFGDTLGPKDNKANTRTCIQVLIFTVFKFIVDGERIK